MCDIEFFLSDEVELVINSIELLDDNYVYCKPINGFNGYKLHKSLLPFKTIGEFKQFILHIDDTTSITNHTINIDANKLTAEHVHCEIVPYDEFVHNWNYFHIASKYPPNFQLIPNHPGLLEHINKYYAQQSSAKNYSSKNSITKSSSENPIKEIVAWHTKSYNEQSKNVDDIQRPVLLIHADLPNEIFRDYCWLNNEIRDYTI